MSLVGNLADLGLGDIFQIVSMSRRSGLLQLTTPEEVGEIVFLAGRVVAASRSQATRTVGEVLLEAGVVSPTTYQEMLAAEAHGTVGAALFESFQVNGEALDQALEAMLSRLVYDMFEWSEGTFSFLLEQEPDLWQGFDLQSARVVLQRGLNPQYLAIEGARLRDERSREDPLESFLARGKQQVQPTAKPAPIIAAPDESGLAEPVRPPADFMAEGADELGDGRAVETPQAQDVQQAEAMAIGDTARAQMVGQPEAEVMRAGGVRSQKIIPFPATRSRRDGGTIPMPAAPAPVVPAPADVAAAEAPEVEPPSVPEVPAPETAHVEASAAAPAPELEEAGAVASAATPVDVPAAPGGEPSLAHWHLVAVDDDATLARFIGDCFAGRCASVVTATKVVDAVAKIEALAAAPVLVATDLILPRSDGRGILGGVEILERVRQRSAGTPVLLFSDYQNEEAEARARNMGVSAFLTKPRKSQLLAEEGGTTPSELTRGFLAKLGEALESAAGALAAAAPQPVAESTPEPASEPASVEAAPVEPTPVEPTPVEPPSAAAAPMDVPAAAPIVPAARADETVMTPVVREMSAELDEQFGDIVEQASQDLGPADAGSGELAALRSMLAELINPANRETITLLVLRFASNIVERAALFLVTRKAFVGLGGFSIEEGSDTFVGRVRRIQVPVDSESVFSRVERYRAVVRAPLADTEGNRRLITGLGGDWHGHTVLAAPLVSSDRVAAILYGDNPSGKPLGSTEGLEIFLQQAGLAMDRALLERKLEESRRRRTDDPE